MRHPTDAASTSIPEIAGYYLQWLVLARTIREFTRARRARCGGASVAWRLACGAAPAADQRPSSEADDDWRNRAVFCFDLAMVLRGLAPRACAPAGRRRLGRGRRCPAARAARRGGRLVRRLRLPTAADDPSDRWSTRAADSSPRPPPASSPPPGTLSGIPAAVERAARATFAASLAGRSTLAHAERIHCSMRSRHHGASARCAFRRLRWRPLPGRFDALLARADADGHSGDRSPRTATGPARVDVIAQDAAHRLSAPRASPDSGRPIASPSRGCGKCWPGTCMRRARWLRLAPSEPAQWNVWAAMFTDQAWRFAVPARDPLPWWRSDPLLV
jgi:hypothetical protein